MGDVRDACARLVAAAAAGDPYRDDPVPFARNFVPVFAAARAAGLPAATGGVVVTYNGETLWYSEADFLAIV